MCFTLFELKYLILLFIIYSKLSIFQLNIYKISYLKIKNLK